MHLQPFAAGVRLPAASLLALIAAGCSSIGGTYESFDVNDGSGAILSADKRAILVWKGVKVKNGNGLSDPREIVACPEPQPDAMRAVAEQFSGAIKAKVKAEAQDGGGAGAEGEGSAEMAKAASEAVAELGKRTPTVQLLRDALYRTCEGVANGVLGTHDVPFIVSQLDNLMLGLHAIDGLTGMHGGPSMSVGTLIREGAPPKDGANTPKEGTPKEGTPKEGVTTTPVTKDPKAGEPKSGEAPQSIALRPHDVKVTIEPDPSKSAATAAVATEVRKIVAISLLDRSCLTLYRAGAEGQTAYNACRDDQRKLMDLAFGAEAPAGGNDAAPGDGKAKPPAKRRSVARLDRD
jgi:hypothetical protein